MQYVGRACGVLYTLSGLFCSSFRDLLLQNDMKCKVLINDVHLVEKKMYTN